MSGAPRAGGASGPGGPPVPRHPHAELLPAHLACQLCGGPQSRWADDGLCQLCRAVLDADFPLTATRPVEPSGTAPGSE